MPLLSIASRGKIQQDFDNTFIFSLLVKEVPVECLETGTFFFVTIRFIFGKKWLVVLLDKWILFPLSLLTQYKQQDSHDTF